MNSCHGQARSREGRAKLVMLCFEITKSPVCDSVLHFVVLFLSKLTSCDSGKIQIHSNWAPTTRTKALLPSFVVSDTLF